MAKKYGGGVIQCHMAICNGINIVSGARSMAMRHNMAIITKKNNGVIMCRRDKTAWRLYLSGGGRESKRRKCLNMSRKYDVWKRKELSGREYISCLIIMSAMTKTKKNESGMEKFVIFIHNITEEKPSCIVYNQYVAEECEGRRRGKEEE
jgi:hypothetical protein